MPIGWGMRRSILFVLLSALAWCQNPQSEQSPRFQPAWPCTGKEPSFDPVYARTAEATGGQLFLLDRSETGRAMSVIMAPNRHPVTLARAAGKMEASYLDIAVPVDSSVDSLYFAVSLQCMQNIILYDPMSVEVKPEKLGGEDHVFRAVRIAVIPKPQPGVWTARLMGAGPYFVAAQAHTSAGFDAEFEGGLPRFGEEQQLTVTMSLTAPDVRFQLVNAAGETQQPLVLTPDPDVPGRFRGRVVPSIEHFRVMAEGTDERGYSFQRVDPRLFDTTLARP
jgi:hypothetical protein